MVIKNTGRCGLLLLCVLFFSTVSLSYGDFHKTKIAVLDFELRGDSFKTRDMGGIVAEWFTTTLVKDGRFEVVERALLQKIIEEQKLGMSGLINEETSTQLGQILGVKTIITGSVLQIGKSIEVNARIINVKTGSIVAAENIRSNSSNNLQKVIELLTERIVKNFPLTGYIVKRKGKSVLIDLGAASGLQSGMEFIVFKEGEVIKHPKTGEVLEVEQILTGKIKVTKIRTNVASGEIIQEEEGQKILYGQLVQSVRKPLPPPVLPQPQLVAAQREKVTKKPPQKVEEKKKKEYVRAEFSPGTRDNLSSGGQAPPVKPLPTGFYMMGGHRFSEKPKHYVKIDRSVDLMVSEVTFADYERFCRDTGNPVPDDFSWGRADRPVINVSWHDAQAYAKWLTSQTGIGYRLPFESEWEWAARAGSDIQYPWGNSFKKGMANCKKCGSEWDGHQTSPVRSFPPNAFGFHDMVGNVWEWVQDCWVENYVNAPDNQTERKYSGKCGNYTIRGGAWNSPVRQTSTSSRLGVWANTKSNYIGFRLVRDPAITVSKAVQIMPGKQNKPTVSDEDDDWDENIQSSDQQPAEWDWGGSDK
jgi:formylglycine-generating enzyme required for sulfatase activity/TolB-like protein